VRYKSNKISNALGWFSILGTRGLTGRWRRRARKAHRTMADHFRNN
jgi:hypothetical protein